MSDQNLVLSGHAVGHKSFQDKKFICSPVFDVEKLLHEKARKWNNTPNIELNFRVCFVDIAVSVATEWHGNFHEI